RGRKNEKEANELALLIMDSVQRYADVLPQLTLRIYREQDPRLKEKAFDMITAGNPYPMLYNDDVNIPSAKTAFRIDESTAEQCIPFGCGEYVLYHQSFGTPSGVINLAKALEIALHKGEDHVGPRPLGILKANAIDIQSFDDLWEAYTQTLEAYIHALAVQEKIEYDLASNHAPFLFFSMLMDDCINRGKAVFAGGIRHLGGTLETYGNTNTSDALLAIKNLVFDQKRISLDELMSALDANFEGYARIRKLLLDQPKYGNDEGKADEMLERVHDHVCRATRDQAALVGLDSYLVVNINNSANTIFGRYTAASADGRLAGTSLANGNTPHMGMDKQGATALLNSIAKPATNIHAGASQNIKFSREVLSKFRSQTIALIDTYFEKGGAQLMITAVNKGDLERAMEYPEEYPNLLVRVGGFSARFVELEKDIQIEIVNRTLY
ncbi:pyruvate formate lyase family protein, partial [Bacteroidota bacterium]